MLPVGAKRFAGAIIAAVAFAAAVPSAHAFSLFGWSPFGDAASQDAAAVIANPHAYSVAFAVSGAPQIQPSLEGVSQLWAGRESPASGAAGLLATARAEYARLLAVLYDNGYYGGTISIRVAGREATQWAPDAALPDPAPVTIAVDTGPQFVFGALVVKTAGAAPLAVALPQGFAEGKVAAATIVRAAAQAEVSAWRKAGYPKAKIAKQDVVADHKANVLNVTLVLDPGPKAVIGVVTAQGSEALDPEFIVHASGLKPGPLYSPEAIAAARARLLALGTFDVVRIVEGSSVSADGSLPLTIIVKDRKPRRIGYGATYSTTDGLGLEGYWLHRNLFGHAEQLRLDAKLAGIAYPIESGKFDYYFGGTFTKPALITADTDLVASLTGQRNVLARYTETSLAASVGLSHTFMPKLKANGAVFAKAANFNDAVYGTRDFALFGLKTGAIYDGRNSTTEPTQGFYLSGTATPFYEAVYGNAALRLAAEGRAYFGFGDGDKFVLAGRLKAGALLGPSLAQSPPDQLFFAGGGGSVRGFPYRSIGVAGPGGTVTGGKFVTEASLEARIRVNNDFGVVGFVDAGYVTADSFVGLAEGTRIGVGAGLRYYTGLGPIRLDLAVPVNKRADDPNYAIYLGIGQAF